MKLKAEMVIHRDGDFHRAEVSSVGLGDPQCVLAGQRVDLKPHEQKVAKVLLLQQFAKQVGTQPCSHFEAKPGL